MLFLARLFWRILMRLRGIAPAALILSLSTSSAHAQRRSTDPLPIGRIRSVIRAHWSEIRMCYTQARGERRDTPPHIDMTFVIRPDGRVTNVTFPPIVSSFALGLCIGRLMQAWQFPCPRDGSTVTVTYPFDF